MPPEFRVVGTPVHNPMKPRICQVTLSVCVYMNVYILVGMFPVSVETQG